MKNFLLILMGSILLNVAITSTNAQAPQPRPTPTQMICLPSAEIDRILRSYGEAAVWVGVTQRLVNGTQMQGFATLHSNKETETWSYIEHYDEIACLVGYGTDSYFNLDRLVGPPA
jgi:hypothetical protein